MTTEWGALAGVFPIDDITISWLVKRAEFINNRGLEKVQSDSDNIDGIHPRMNTYRISELTYNPIEADKTAFYAKHLKLNLNTVSPHISGPNHVKKITSIQDAFAQNIIINKAYLVSCVNSRVEDLTEAANTIKGKGFKLFENNNNWHHSVITKSIYKEILKEL